MFSNPKRHLYLGAFALAAVVVAGCNKGPRTVPVVGTVTLDGKPVEGAAVTFVPTAEGQPAMSITDAQGKFTLSTGTAAGAVPGTYAVTVVKMKEDAEASEEGDPESEGLMGEENIEVDSDLYVVPQKYSDPETSGLTVEVKPGMEPVNLDLTSG